MVIGRMRGAIKAAIRRSLSIAMAAALAVTSVPQFSAAAMAQEGRDVVEERTTDEKTSETAEQSETEEAKTQSESSTDTMPTDAAKESETVEKTDAAETQETETRSSDTEKDTETVSESESETEGNTDETVQDETEDESETETEEEEKKKDSDSDKERVQEQTEGKEIYKNNFDSLTEGEELAGGKIAKLADGNMAVEYVVDLSQSSGWTELFQPDMQVSPAYTTAIKEKMTMSFDVYFPDSAGDIGTLKAKAVLKVGDDWTWTQGDELKPYTTENLETGDISGYKKLHVVLDLSSQTGWNVEDITSIQVVIPCLAGDTSTYKGKLYLDNVLLSDTSTDSGDNTPSANEEIIYENNFDSLADASIIEEADGKTAELATIAEGNKAVKFTTDLSASSGWTNIFNAQINLPEEYAKPISEKVVMSYDVYFPESSIKADFGTIKAQGVLKSGAGWTWITQQSWPDVDADRLTDSGISGYKAFHVEIDMNNFKGPDGNEYPFEQITPIKTVVPCLAGDVSKYAGDVYLDNLVVKAVNKSEEIPDVKEDLVLDLKASAWKVSDGYQYSGQSTVRNEKVGEKDFLVMAMDYSKNTDKDWSEAKFDYTHPEEVASLQGYNAFKADIYYKPEDKTAGSFAVKLFSSSPKIEKNVDMPAGEPVDIPGLEGYYKAEYEMSLRIPAGAFSSLTFGLVGKSTDFKGDIYLDNMRFTKVTAEDIYVDSTILPKKGAGIQIVDDGRSLQTASGSKVAITEEAALVDANAIEATKNLYAYLKAVGESDSVIFGHQNDTHKKAGSSGEGFSNSDTEDLTGSIAGVIGLDALSLTGNEASTWDTPEADRIAEAVRITKEASAKGALITLSAHMPNFDVIDKRVKAYEASDKSANDSDSVGYWDVNGDRQYNFSGYTPGTLTGNVVTRIMPGQDLNYLYTDYLDLIADYAKAVEGDGITILFRPFHENTGSWFWWGAALCDEQAYINVFRYTVDYLKETKGVHNILYVYGPGSEAANVTEYAARYPGDDYVDMIGYDLYHQTPTAETQPGYLQSISKQNAILKEFAEAHNKLYAITETGVADKNTDDKNIELGKSIALRRKGNKIMDWYMQLLNEITDDGVCYFLVWANFNDSDSFYLPYVTEKKDGGILHGHEMMDEFIKFYNDERSIFASDMNNEFKKITGVTNTTKADAVSGYITAPQSGDRILPDTDNPDTHIEAKISGVDPTQAVDVKFIAATEFDEVVLKASYNEEKGVWQAVLKDSALESLGEVIGTITLYVNNNEISKITVKFNMQVPVQDDMNPEDFEGYNGDSQQLGLVWATNKASGSEISLALTDDAEKVFGGKYGLQMNVTLAAADAWAGATKSFEADWSGGNAFEFYTVPETKGQKIVVQVTAGGNVFEIYLQEYEQYTHNAVSGVPVKVTIPFSAFIGRDDKEAKFDPSRIESIGLWCNAIAKEGVEFPLSTTLYYDEFKVVTTDLTEVQLEGTIKEGIWVKEIPAQAYTGKAVKPEIQVYDYAKLLTPKKDYTVTYKNNTNAGKSAKVIIKGKGNYNETIEKTFTISPKELDSTVITYTDYLAHNNREQKINVTVKDGKKKLSGKKDYTQVITYNERTVTKAKDEGVYAIKLTGKGNYTGEVIVNCEVVKGKELLSKASVTLPSSKLAYSPADTGAVFDASKIKVKIKGKEIPQKEADGTENYTIGYENNKEAGAVATVVIKACEGSKYVGSCRKDFRIEGKKFSTKTIDIAGLKTTVDYTGKSVFQSPTLKDKTESNKVLERNVDYTITNKGNLNAGKATITFTGRGKYSGTIKKTYTISKVTLKADMIENKVIQTEQNRAGATPDITITCNGKKLVRNRDYTLSYVNNKNITTSQRKAYITITGKGNYTGKLQKAVELQILPKSWQSDDITIEVPDMKYSANKREYKPNPVVCDNGKKLVKGKDYTVEYQSNKKADVANIAQEPNGHTATAVITVISPDYKDGNNVENNKREVPFRIIGKLISKAKVEIKTPQYFKQNGTRPSKADLKVTYEGKTVADDEYQIISYAKDMQKGKATLVIQGLGQYGGTKTVSYKINARGIHKNLAKAMAKMVSVMLEQL